MANGDRDWVLSELERVRAHKSELEAHRRRETQLIQQLAELDAALAEHRPARKALPLLDRIKVASPCTASWTDMSGDDVTRHCGSCDQDVHDLSAMSRDAAEAFLQRLAGQGACVRFYRRADGTVLTQGDCPVGTKKKRRRALLVAAAGAGMVGAGALYSFAQSQVMGNLQAGPGQVMGGMLPMPVEAAEDAGALDPLVPAEKPAR